jgi:hypothetical protein
MDALRERLGYVPTVDVAAEKRTAVCASYFDESIDGLAQEWPEGWFGNVPWNNIPPWIDKARGSPTGLKLLPVRTERDWFQAVVEDKRHWICFLKPRLSYYYPDGWTSKGKQHPPGIRPGISHGSMLIEFNSPHPGVGVEEFVRPAGADR